MSAIQSVCSCLLVNLWDKYVDWIKMQNEMNLSNNVVSSVCENVISYFTDFFVVIFDKFSCFKNLLLFYFLLVQQKQYY